MFGSLVRSYTRYIQGGKVPCLHEAAKEMIDFENQNTLHEAENVYKKEMQKLIRENMPNSEAMAKHHKQCMEKAIEYLRCNIIYDDVELFLDTAKVCIHYPKPSFSETYKILIILNLGDFFCILQWKTLIILVIPFRMNLTFMLCPLG